MSDTTLGIGLIVALFVGVFATFLVPPAVREWRARQVLAAGLPAQARVTDLVRTGNTVNDQPEVTIHLQVMPDGRAPFPATVTRVLGVADAELFGRGQVVAVKFDPARPGRVALVPAPR